MAAATQYDLTTIDGLESARAEEGSWAALSRTTDIPVTTLKSRAQGAGMQVKTIKSKNPLMDARNRIYQEEYDSIMKWLDAHEDDDSASASSWARIDRRCKKVVHVRTTIPDKEYFVDLERWAESISESVSDRNRPILAFALEIRAGLTDPDESVRDAAQTRLARAYGITRRVTA